MSKKLDQIRDRRAKLEAELTQLAAVEKRAAKHAQRQRERRIIRAMRQSGVLAHDEAVVLREIANICDRLKHRATTPPPASQRSAKPIELVEECNSTTEKVSSHE